MKKLVFLFFFISSVNLNAQNMGEWTWMKGSNTIDSPGFYGIKGIPDIANYPPGLYEACSWTDTAGNFWLFGGSGKDYNIYNALWKYNTLNNTWVWVNGSDFSGDIGHYGIKGIPSSTNCPPYRGFGIMSWTDINNNLWLYGGWGAWDYQDLWKYDISTNEWTWMSGANSSVQITHFGNKGIPSANNSPPPIQENNCTWVHNNNLLFFGGIEFSENEDYYNDLWEYNISTNVWTWIYGNAIPDFPPDYGQKGIPSPSNNPGGRASYSSSKDYSGNFYLFGSGKNFFYGTGLTKISNDIWKYDLNSKIWTWISGENIYNSNGIYGNSCVPENILTPRSRYEVRASWTDTCGFWIYGGINNNSETLSDFWRYDFTYNMWTRIKGSINTNEVAVYGNYQVSSQSNTPGCRGGSVSWVDKKGNLWMFGGLFGISGGYFSDLWRYVPDTNCVKLCLPKSNPPIPNPNPDTLNPEIKIPNIFTPNADGKNDKFEIIAKNFKTYYLQVFNRWGVLVFESKDAATLWDGTMHNHGNACADGVYFYILNLTDFKQNTTQHKGSVTILR